MTTEINSMFHLNESVFAEKLKNFLNTAWLRPEEKKIITIINKNKDSLIKNGEDGKEYIKQFLLQNKNTIETSCTEAFATELNKLGNEYLTESEGAEPKVLNRAIERLSQILEKQKNDVWSIATLSASLQNFQKNYQNEISDDDLWDYIGQAIYQKQMEQSRATIKLSIERLKELKKINPIMPTTELNEALCKIIKEDFNDGTEKWKNRDQPATQFTKFDDEMIPETLEDDINNNFKGEFKYYNGTYWHNDELDNDDFQQLVSVLQQRHPERKDVEDVCEQMFPHDAFAMQESKNIKMKNDLNSKIGNLLEITAVDASGKKR